MSLALWCLMHERNGDHRDYKRKLFKLFAFAGRYAHQNWGDLMTMTISEIYLLCEETAAIMAEEKEGCEVD